MESASVIANNWKYLTAELENYEAKVSIWE